MCVPPSSAANMFISYSRKDKGWMELLRTHLAPHKIQISTWADEDIPPGTEWEKEIKEAIRDSQAAVALVTPDYLASDFIMEKELRLLMAEKEQRPFQIHWVHVRTCWYSSTVFSGMQALHNPERSLESLSESERGEAMVCICKRLNEVLSGPPEEQGPIDHPERPPWNVPYPRNPHVKGMNKAIAEVCKTLQGKRGAAVSLSAAVQGLAGIGKTQLAVEYAYRHKESYSAVLWVSAKSEERFWTGLAGLAGPCVLNLDARTDPLELVRCWLRDHDGWLLIVDGADSPAVNERVLRWLPTDLRGHVLITTRLAHWAPGIAVINLDVLSEGDAVRFLLTRTGRPGKEKEGATELARCLGCLPVALEQAAAYIRRHKISFDSYRERLDDPSCHLLDEVVEGGTDYRRSVAETLLLTMKQLRPLSRCLLRVVAFYSPTERIPRELIISNAETLWARAVSLDEGETAGYGTQNARAAVEDALAELNDYALIRLMEKDFSLHPVLQQVQLAALRDEKVTGLMAFLLPRSHRWAHRRWLRLALRLADDYLCLEQGHETAWARWESIRSHITMAEDHCREYLHAPTALSGRWRVRRSGRAIQNQVMNLDLKGSDIIRLQWGPESPLLARGYQRFERILTEAGRNAEAEKFRSQADALLNQWLAETNRKMTQATITDLGTIFREMQALAAEEVDIKRYPQIIELGEKFANNLRDQGRLDEANLLSGRLTILRATLGSDEPPGTVEVG